MLNTGINLHDKKLGIIVERMQNISKQIEKRVEEVNSDIITTRKDPEIVELWNKLCILHLRGLSILQKCDNANPEFSLYIRKHQTCIKFLHLTEEQTCCKRLFSDMKIQS